MAERLGRTVGELESGMTYRELVEWSAYDTWVALEDAKRANKSANDALVQGIKKGKFRGKL